MTKKKAKVIYCHVKGTVYRCPPALPRQRGTAPSCTLSLSLGASLGRLTPSCPHPCGTEGHVGTGGCSGSQGGWDEVGGCEGAEGSGTGCRGFGGGVSAGGDAESVAGTRRSPHREPCKGLGGAGRGPPRAAVSEGGLGVGVMGRGGHQGGHSYMAEPGESSGCPGGQCVPKALVPTQG